MRVAVACGVLIGVSAVTGLRLIKPSHSDGEFPAPQQVGVGTSKVIYKESIPIGKEFQAILAEGVGAKIHSAIEQEARDAEWATAMEGRWSSHLASTRLTSRTPLVSCRTTRCEIQLLTVVPAGRDSRELFDALLSGAPGIESKARNQVMWKSQTVDGVTALVCYVSYTRSD